jgi:hypothetical protein
MRFDIGLVQVLAKAPIALAGELAYSVNRADPARSDLYIPRTNSPYNGVTNWLGLDSKLPKQLDVSCHGQGLVELPA